MILNLPQLTNPPRFSRKRIGGILLLVVLVGGSLATAYVFHSRYQKAVSLLANPEKLVADNKNVILEKIKAIIELPDEEPSTATVTDVESIRNQPFFAKAKNDDMVVIFYKEGKALLYRPSENKIINWAFLDTGQVAGARSAAPSPTLMPSPSMPSIPLASITVAIYNGTVRGGLASAAEERLIGKIPEARIITKANTAKSDYKKTIVVDMTGIHQDMAGLVASVLEGETGILPSGESTPSAQIAVILGEDFQK